MCINENPSFEGRFAILQILLLHLLRHQLVHLPLLSPLQELDVLSTQELDLLAINKYFLQESRDAHILSEIPGSIHLIPPVRIDPKVSVGQAAKIGPNVYLESGATVGQGAVLRDTLVLSGASVAAHEHCYGQIVDRRVRISKTDKVELHP